MSVTKQGRHDLRLQLLALYLLFVVPIFALGLIFYLNASRQLRNDIVAADLSLARAIALETDDMLLKAREAIAAYAQMPVVVNGDRTGMEQAFAAGAAARQDINLFYRLSPMGIMLYHYPPSPGSTIGQDFSFRDYFQAAQRSGQHVFSKGRISPTTGRPVVSSVMPIFIDSQFDGLVATNLELQRLSESVQRISPENSGGEKIVIVDSAGQVVAHSETATLLQSVRDSLPGVDLVLTGQEGSFTAYDDEGTEWLYSYTPVPSAGWGVIVQRPTRQAFASLDNFQRGLVLALLIFGLGALFFWSLLSRRVINPLVTLTRYSETTGEERGEFGIGRKLILGNAERPDQIGQLTRTLLSAEENVRRRLLELTTLNKTSAVVVSTLDTEQVIASILDEVQRLLSVRQCALLLMNEETQRLELHASRGLSADYSLTIPRFDEAGHQPVIQAIETNQPVQIPDIEPGSVLSPEPLTIQTQRSRSALIIPIEAPHIPPAVLIIYRAEIHYFTKSEVDLATSFANHAAIALEHAMLFNLTDAELQKQVLSLSALNRVGRSVSQSLVLGDVLNNAMETVLEVMPADACWLYLQREAENFLRLRAQRGLPAEAADRIRDRRLEHNQGVIGQVAASGTAILLDHNDLVPQDWPTDPIITEGIWYSLAAAPLMAKDTVIGVLGISTRTDHSFTEADVDLLQAIGDQITIAVVNARLYRRSRETATLAERNRVAREIHDTLAQGFTGILVQLQAAERLSRKQPEVALQSLHEARELARQSLHEARRSVLNLRPTILENLTLDQAIAQQTGQFEAETGIRTIFDLEGYPSPLSTTIEQNLYRIVQEALTNVRRHAQAKNVQITLAFDAGYVSLTVIDDGKGLNGHHLADLTTFANGHFGLVGIQERTNLMQGQLFLENPTRGGTRIKVVIPV